VETKIQVVSSVIWKISYHIKLNEVHSLRHLVDMS